MQDMLNEQQIAMLEKVESERGKEAAAALFTAAFVDKKDILDESKHEEMIKEYWPPVRK